MYFYAHAKQNGFILVSSLIVLALLSFIMIRAFELSLMQAHLLQLFQHKTQLLNQAEDSLHKLDLKLRQSDLSSGADYKINFDHEDSCLNRYYQIETWAVDSILEAHIQAVFMKVPTQGLKDCDYKKGDSLVVEKIF